MTTTNPELNTPLASPPTRLSSRPTQFADQLSSWPVWIVSGGIFVAFAAVFFTSSAPFSIRAVEAACEQAPPDVRFFSTSSDIDNFLTNCGQAGRLAYRNMQLADLFYPLVFGLFMASSLAVALTRLFPSRPRLVRLAWLPIAGSVFDYIENIFAWRALTAFPEPASTNSLIGIASALKTSTFWISGVLLLAAGTAIAARSLRRHLMRPRSSLG